MVESTVKVSMREDNDLDCSYAIVSKEDIGVILILRRLECAIFNYASLKSEDFDFHYLLLKHYADEALAYRDFLKLIGKMCKKDKSSKYFQNPREEDNRMICTADGREHEIRGEERSAYRERYAGFQAFLCRSRHRF